MKIRIRRRSFSLYEVYQRFARAVVASLTTEAYLRIFHPKRDNSVVIFGHNLDGNLRAFAEYLNVNHPSIPCYLMVDDFRVYRRLRHGGYPGPVAGILSSQRLRDLLRIGRSKVLITSHGPVSLWRWPTIPRARRPLMIDVWHGVGYKAPRAAMAKMAGYDNHFVPSQVVADFYEKSGVPAPRITVTGFARTDSLVDLALTANERRDILRSYGLDPGERRTIVVYAPTWDEKEGSDIYPFGLSAADFFRSMNDFAKKHDFLMIFRPHINTNWHLDANYSKNLQLLSAAEYPVAENLLKVTDVLITDWSSIFAEFLALGRPIIFIDKTPSFGTDIAPLSLDDRPGAVATNLADFQQALCDAVVSPDSYLRQYRQVIHNTIEHAWADTLDGHSAERYYQTIQQLLGDDKFIDD